MKRLGSVGRFPLLSLFLAFGFAITMAPVQARAENRDGDITLRELQNFDNFLDAHPAIDKDLKMKPALATDKAYLAAHPDLRTFLGSHPGVREEMKQNGRFFMRREQQFDHSKMDITLNEVRTFDNFLDRHPAIDRELEKKPALINDSDYIAKHPELKEYLGAHPRVRADLKENPRAFMLREKQLDKRENKVAAKPGPKATIK